MLQCQRIWVHSPPDIAELSWGALPAPGFMGNIMPGRASPHGHSFHLHAKPVRSTVTAHCTERGTEAHGSDRTSPSSHPGQGTASTPSQAMCHEVHTQISFLDLLPGSPIFQRLDNVP